MAEADEQVEGEEEQSAKGSKKLIILIAVAVLLIGGGVAGWLMMSGNETAEADAETEAPAEPAVLPVSYISLGEKFVVTIAEGRKQRYVQAQISVSTRDTEVVTAIEVHAPLIRSKVIETLGAADFQVLRTDEGRKSIQADLLAQVNALLEAEGLPPSVEALFFTDFVLQ